MLFNNVMTHIFSAIFLIYSMIDLWICKYEPFWQEVSAESLILSCLPLRSTELLFSDVLKIIWLRGILSKQLKDYEFRQKLGIHADFLPRHYCCDTWLLFSMSSLESWDFKYVALWSRLKKHFLFNALNL